MKTVEVLQGVVFTTNAIAMYEYLSTHYTPTAFYAETVKPNLVTHASILHMQFYNMHLPLSCWTRICPAFANSVDPDQLASSEANWFRSALLVIKYVNLYH